MSDVNVIEASGLHKRFVEGGLDVPVLQGVDLCVGRGEALAIVGASGSGKSTLLHLLGGLEAPSKGTVRLAGRDFSHMNAAEQGAWRNRHLGFADLDCHQQDRTHHRRRDPECRSCRSLRGLDRRLRGRGTDRQGRRSGCRRPHQPPGVRARR